jgi:hypothetical protein
MLNALTIKLLNPCVVVVAQAPQCIMSTKNWLCERVVVKNLFPSSLWFADKTLQAFTSHLSSKKNYPWLKSFSSKIHFQRACV